MSEILSENQYGEWDDFVREAKGGTIFHTTLYLRPLAKELQVHVLRDDDGRIQAGMAVTPSRFLGTRAARRPFAVAYNGPLVREDESLSLVDRNSAEKKLVLALLAQSPAMGMYDYILPPEYTDVMPFLWNGFESSIGYTYQIAPAPAEQLEAEMSKNHRKNLRRARKKIKEINGTIETNGDPAEFHEMLRELAMEDEFRLGCDERTFVPWLKSLCEADAATLYVCRDGDGQALIGNVAVHDWRCAYAVVGGVRGGRLTGKEGYLHRLVLERMIQDAHNRNLTFDFEGSVLPGVEPYFRRWGGKCVPKYRVIKIGTCWTYAAWALHRYLTRHRTKKWFLE